MKLCDKCFNGGDYRPGPHSATLGVENYDLCESCANEIRELISNPSEKVSDERAEKNKPGKRRPGRPKKKQA